jgi:hypothetical protein
MAVTDRMLMVEVAGIFLPRPVRGRLAWFEPGTFGVVLRRQATGSSRAAGKVEFPVLLTNSITGRVAGIGNQQEV